MIRGLLIRALAAVGYQLVRMPRAPKGTSAIPDAHLYRPFFCPWLVDREFEEIYREISLTTIVSVDRCYVLWTLALQALNGPGDLVECGVYQGGTARLLAKSIGDRDGGARLHLFDTFSGMPPTGPADLHQARDFKDTDLRRVKEFVGVPDRVSFHPGRIPETFRGMEELSVAFAHVDVDIYEAVKDCCAFVYPRLRPGGFLVFDDYGFPSCPGARKAVDEFFADKRERPLVLPNGQALVIRSGSAVR